MAKYLIDASIIASSQEDFQRRFVKSDTTLVMSDLTFEELESRKKDSHCSSESKKFVRFLIDLFIRDSSTEVCRIPCGVSKHIDSSLVGYAKENNMIILTCDKGMALQCRFFGTSYELLETRSVADLPFVFHSDNSLYINLYNRTIPFGIRIYAYSPSKNKSLSPLENGLIFLNPCDILLVAHPENEVCSIDTYYINSELGLNLISKNIYTSEDNIDDSVNPFHKLLYKKWSELNIKNS